MKRLVILLVLCVIGGLLVWGVRSGQQEIKRDAENDQPLNAPSRAENGVVTLSAKAQEAAGIQTAVPQNGQLPASAIVWWEGKPYAYVEQSPGSYRRTPIDPTEKTSITQPIVITGAQLLLSEELRSGIRIED